MDAGGDDSSSLISPADVRHRLANVFQLLSTLTRMRAQRATEPEVRRQLSWMLDAMGALGALQPRLFDPAGADFAQYLADMLPQWRRRCAGRPLQIELQAEPVLLREQLASALAVITSELVTNALTHAHPEARAGIIRVHLERLPDDRGALTISDDGVGYLQVAEDRTKLGLWLIKGLTEQVKGVLTVTTANGVTARLEFPIGAGG